MVGVSGSGKTTWVNSHKQYTVCSTDSIIEELASSMGISYTDAFEYIQNKKKFDYITQKFFEKIRNCILNDDDFIIDRTHLKRNVRISLINELKTIATENGKHLELFAVSFEIPNNIIFERLKNRERKTQKFIPKQVIYEQINSFNIPTMDEGFNAIERIN
ncbi:MAG: ATP-binding protein [Nitrosarchaeum sp.]|jgi:predicted kinase|nr:ATP-binding protein [Nitrosarchaeum sp.]